MDVNFINLALAFAHSGTGRNALGAACDQYLSRLLKKPVLHHYPPAVMIEPTNICNLKCPLCLSGNGQLKRSKGMMPLNRFVRIVDQIKRKTGMLILWNQGEPFLNKDFYAMLEYASTQGIYTMTSTNASLELDIKRIVKSGLNKIIISMDGISKESYDNYRINGDFELVLQNMRDLVKQKRIQRNSQMQIVWQFIIMRHNENELSEVRHLAKELAVDKLELKTVQIYTPEDLKYLPSDHKNSRYTSSNDRFELKTVLKNRCRRLWTQPVINWDGEMNICCYDKDGSFPIGNIDSHSFAELWFGEKMQKMRSIILKNRAAIEICRNCGEGIIQKIKA